MSIIVVLGARVLLLMVKDLLAQNSPPEKLAKKPSTPKRKRKAISPQRSIEIDPSEIDRIYVKKSS